MVDFFLFEDRLVREKWINKCSLWHGSIPAVPRSIHELLVTHSLQHKSRKNGKKTKFLCYPSVLGCLSPWSHAVAQSPNLTGPLNKFITRAGGETKPAGLSQGNYPAHNYFPQNFLHFPSGLFKEKEAYNNFSPESGWEHRHSTLPLHWRWCLSPWEKQKSGLTGFKSSHLCHLFFFNNCPERLGPYSWVPILQTRFVSDIFTALAINK